MSPVLVFFSYLSSLSACVCMCVCLIQQPWQLCNSTSWHLPEIISGDVWWCAFELSTKIANCERFILNGTLFVNRIPSSTCFMIRMFKFLNSLLPVLFNLSWGYRYPVCSSFDWNSDPWRISSANRWSTQSVKESYSQNNNSSTHKLVVRVGKVSFASYCIWGLIVNKHCLYHRNDYLYNKG